LRESNDHVLLIVAELGSPKNSPKNQNASRFEATREVQLAILCRKDEILCGYRGENSCYCQTDSKRDFKAVAKAVTGD
jgi:hypothetical protein